MAKKDSAASTEAGRTNDRPVVGIRATPDAGAGGVARAICRAHRHDLDAMVVIDADVDGAVRTVAERLGATLVELDPHDVATSNVTVARALVGAARAGGYPGVIWHSDPSASIDVRRTVERLHESDEYWVESLEPPAVDPAPHVLIAIPAYNEAGTIGDVVSDARWHADEVLVVDDGSSDGTADRAERAGATVIEHEANRGYGAALKTAFREAERCGTAHLVTLDGDGQHDPGDVPALIRAQRATDAEVVVGCRFGDGTETNLPLYRRVGLGVVNSLTNLSMGVVRPTSRVRDTQSGFRAYGERAIRTIATDDAIGDHMGASTDILHHAHRHDYRIEEVETTIDYDVEDASTRSAVSHGLTLVNNLLRTIEEERPVSVIGVPGVVSIAVGVGFGYATVVNFLRTQTFPLGFAVTSTVFLLVGTFACFTAIILHALNQHLDD